VTSNAGSVFAVLTGTRLTGFLCLSVLHPDDVAKPARISRTRGLTFVRRLKEACSDGGADDRFLSSALSLERQATTTMACPTTSANQ